MRLSGTLVWDCIRHVVYIGKLPSLEIIPDCAGWCWAITRQHPISLGGWKRCNLID